MIMENNSDHSAEDLCEAIARVEAAGYTCTREPTLDERLQNEWGLFLMQAQTLEDLVVRLGARLLRPEWPWKTSVAMQIINRAVAAVERSAR